MCPKIVSREEWDARESVNPLENLNTVVNYTVIHHSATPQCFSKEVCAKSVKGFQTYHIDYNKWDDIAYSFIIGEDGNIYEGRGWNKIGYSPALTRDSVTICLIGNFMTIMPNELALNAVKQLIECGVHLGFISKQYILKGHRDLVQFGGPLTECPG